jgi:hypothetical protein
MIREAIISECGAYRYRLDRKWSGDPPMLVCMLNPSTADAERDDPTITKLIGFANRFGFGHLIVVNLYPFRATKPADLKAAHYPNPSNNASVIHAAVRQVKQPHDALPGMTFCAWGANARGRPEAAHFLAGLCEESMTPFAFRLLSDGTPEHPLYIPYSATPVIVKR